MEVDPFVARPTQLEQKAHFSLGGIRDHQMAASPVPRVDAALQQAAVLEVGDVSQSGRFRDR